MAHLDYNGIRLYEVKTNTFRMDPWTDPSGLHPRAVKITLEVVGVLHPRWLASSDVRPAATYDDPRGQATDGRAPDNGDRLGISILKLRETMLTPRRQLRYYMGNDLVIDCPERVKAIPNPINLVSDPAGGPTPMYCTVVDPMGDKTGFVLFGIQCVVTNVSKHLLSHTWSTVSRVDQYGYETTTISGTATFRRDFLEKDNLQVDDFRGMILPQPDTGKQRESIEVHIDDTGTVMRYTVQDSGINYGAGQDSGVIDIDVVCTGGVTAPIKDAAAWWGYMGKLGTGLGTTAAGLFTGQLWLAGLGAWGTASTLSAGSIPEVYANVVVRVTGGPQASRKSMALLAVDMCSLRFLNGVKGNNKVKPNSAYITANWGSRKPPYVELYASFFVDTLTTLSAIFDKDPGQFFNWDESSLGTLPANSLRSGEGAPRLPHNNTRGIRARRIVTQILHGSGTVPPSMPASETGTRTKNPRNANI